MEESCWNCESPNHHRRECPFPPNKDFRKKIQKAFQKGSGKDTHFVKNSRQLEKMIEKQVTNGRVNEPLPPVVHYNKEVDRLGQVFYDLKSLLEELPSPISSISADCLNQRRQTVDLLQTKLEDDKPNFLLVTSLKQNYQRKLKVDEILLAKIEDLSLSRKHLTDNLFVLRNQLDSASAVMMELNMDVLKEYISIGKEAYSGRPLKIAYVKAEWAAKKKLLKEKAALVQKFKYLFPETDQEILDRNLDDLTMAWKELKGLKLASEAEPPKALCKICYEADVQYAIIPCGHCFCGECMQGLEECGNCRGPMEAFLELFL